MHLWCQPAREGQQGRVLCMFLCSHVFVIPQKLFSGGDILIDSVQCQSLLDAGDALLCQAARYGTTDFPFLSSVGTYHKFPLNTYWGIWLNLFLMFPSNFDKLGRSCRRDVHREGSHVQQNDLPTRSSLPLLHILVSCQPREAAAIYILRNNLRKLFLIHSLKIIIIIGTIFEFPIDSASQLWLLFCLWTAFVHFVLSI